MINRELQKVQVITFKPGTDKYGQKRKNGEEVPREIEMVIKYFHQQNVNDIRYNDITEIGLTKDDKITDKDQIIANGNRYNVLYVIPSGRLHQILMKRV